MNLVIVSPFPPYRGGISKESEVLYEGFLRNNTKVKAVNFIKLYPDVFFPGKSQYSKNNKFNNSHRLLNTLNPFSWKKTAIKINSFKFDTVLFRYWHPILIPSYYFIIKNLNKINPKIKIFCICDNVFPHENFLYFDRYIIKFLLKKFNGIFCMSSIVRNQIESIYSNCNLENIFLPVKDFGKEIPKNTATERLGIKGKKIILFFGIIREYKGLKILLESISKLKEKTDNFTLLIAGECYDSKEKYLKLIRRLGVSDQLVWIDEYIPDDKINLYFSASDVVVLPYTKSTQSGILPIAYNYNKIVVASKVLGLKEFIINNKTGFLFSPNNSDDLTKILYKIIILNDTEKYKNNIINYKKQFSLECLIKKMTVFMNK